MDQSLISFGCPVECNVDQRTGNGYFRYAHDFPAMTDWPVSRLLEEPPIEKLRVRNDFDRTHIEVVSSVLSSRFLPS